MVDVIYFNCPNIPEEAEKLCTRLAEALGYDVVVFDTRIYADKLRVYNLSGRRLVCVDSDTAVSEIARGDPPIVVGERASLNDIRVEKGLEYLVSAVDVVTSAADGGNILVVNINDLLADWDWFLERLVRFLAVVRAVYG
jgi:hypothetical protein